MINNPTIFIIIPNTTWVAKGIILRPISKSRNTPISTMFKIVPSPSFSPSNNDIIPIANPVIMEAVPILSPIIFANPTWKTSQGAYPIWAFIVTTIPRAYRKSPNIKRRRRA